MNHTLLVYANNENALSISYLKIISDTLSLTTLSIGSRNLEVYFYRQSINRNFPTYRTLAATFSQSISRKFATDIAVAVTFPKTEH